MEKTSTFTVSAFVITAFFFFLHQDVTGRQSKIRTEITSQVTHEQEKHGLPEYRCRRVAKPLKLSGKLDDPQWQNAPPAKLYDAITGKPGRFATEVRALYGDEYLYISFRCEDDFVWGTVAERDGPIWDEECVEIFINPAGIAHQYYEINLSPQNVIFDACVLNKRSANKPNETFLPLTGLNLKEIKTAVHIDGEINQAGKARAWTAEYAIPLAELIGAPNIPPGPGDVWRINFYRIDSPQKGLREHYAWSMTGRAAFHLPWRFGYLVFESSNQRKNR